MYNNPCSFQFKMRPRVPAGTKIHVQTGEILQRGNFYNDNLRSAKSEYIYISDGTEMDLVPHFTFYGYRYVKIEGIPDLKKEDFTGLSYYSNITATGWMKTGSDLVNQLISNVRWGLKCNFVDVPTDCPQRDERMGWTGDAQVFSPTAMYLEDTYAFYAKYLYDMAKEQSVLGGKVPHVVPSCGIEDAACVWGDAACIIPWNLYLFYGDKSILEDQFVSMKSWVDYITKVDGDNHGWRYVFHFGDWLALDNPVQGAEQVMGATDEEFIANLYYAISAGIVAKAAARTVPLTDEEKLLIKNYGLLTLKPVMFVANVSEDGFENNSYLDAVRQIAKEQGATVVAVSAQTEVELLEMPEEDRAMFLSDMGMEEPGLNRVIRAAYDLLGLQTFFTSGEKETRAWTIHKGDTAPKAAGVIHTDFERGFIRAQTIAFDDYIKYHGEKGAQEAGKERAEGKDYVVHDGDIMNFLFNV